MPNQFHRDAIVRVLAYVEKNKDRELSLDEISKIARVSKFHFHRLFSAHMGVSIGQYLKLKRLKKGMFELIYTKNSMLFFFIAGDMSCLAIASIIFMGIGFTKRMLCSEMSLLLLATDIFWKRIEIPKIWKLKFLYQ